MGDNSGARVGSDLFIIDNSDNDWDVLRYLSGWCRLSRQLDVASAYFEIGSLLSLEGQWQQVDKIRVLMGDEISRKTKQAFAEALSDRLARLDSSVEAEKIKGDFLDGVPAIVEAIQKGRIEFRIYRPSRFHAKAYITRSREDVIGSFALVGSSNFTRPGLTSNVELNVQITGANYINPSRWFETVPEVAWNFHIGGYQPAQKWLKDRAAKKSGKNANPGRVLTNEDILHYRRIILALTRTAELMPKIDNLIDEHGGWPSAFRGIND